MTKGAKSEPQAHAAPERLRRRSEFLRAAASGVSRQLPAFKLQMAQRDEDPAGAPRFGITVTKKVAGAVGRNRIRRRLREALRLCGAAAAPPGSDYVLIARRASLTAPFSDLATQLAEGLARVSRSGALPQKPRSRPPAP